MLQKHMSWGTTCFARVVNATHATSTSLTCGATSPYRELGVGRPAKRPLKLPMEKSAIEAVDSDMSRVLTTFLEYRALLNWSTQATSVLPLCCNIRRTSRSLISTRIATEAWRLNAYRSLQAEHEPFRAPLLCPKANWPKHCHGG